MKLNLFQRQKALLERKGREIILKKGVVWCALSPFNNDKSSVFIFKKKNKDKIEHKRRAPVKCCFYLHLKKLISKSDRSIGNDALNNVTYILPVLLCNTSKTCCMHFTARHHIIFGRDAIYTLSKHRSQVRELFMIMFIYLSQSAQMKQGC